MIFRVPSTFDKVTCPAAQCIVSRIRQAPFDEGILSDLSAILYNYQQTQTCPCRNYRI